MEWGDLREKDGATGKRREAKIREDKKRDGKLEIEREMGGWGMKVASFMSNVNTKGTLYILYVYNYV